MTTALVHDGPDQYHGPVFGLDISVMRVLLLGFATALWAGALDAQTLFQDRQGVGNGRLFTNDALGDGLDHWRTGSFVFSHLRAPDAYTGTLPPLGDLLEYRLRSEIISPESLLRRRPYVGMLSAGLHTHFGLGALETRIGADAVVVGPQTGLDDFQTKYHEIFDMPEPTTSPQLNDDVFLNISGEVRRTYAMGNRTTVRPFAEAQLGTEDIARVGADLIFGRVGQDDLLVRDTVTGLLYPGALGNGAGIGFVVGGDLAAVGENNLIPRDSGYDPTSSRHRARAGVTWQPNPALSLFYGATYLSPEFEEQPEGQVVGSVRLNFNF